MDVDMYACLYIYTYIHIYIYGTTRCIQLLTKLVTEDFEEEQHDRIFKIFKHISINISTCGLRPTIMYTTLYNQPRACGPGAPAEARPKTCQHPGRWQWAAAGPMWCPQWISPENGGPAGGPASKKKHPSTRDSTCFNKGKMMRDWDILGWLGENFVDASSTNDHGDVRGIWSLYWGITCWGVVEFHDWYCRDM